MQADCPVALSPLDENRRLAALRALADSPPLLWSFLYFFSLLCGYYVLRPVREAMGARQQTEIAARLDADTGLQAQRIHQQLTADLHPMLRLPLAALAFPVLRQRPRPQLDAFLDAVDAVVHADGDVSLFEYCLAQLLRVHVREALDPARYARFGRRKPGSVRREFATLLAVVAQAGHQDDASAQRAYLAGLQRVLPRDHLPYAPPAKSPQVAR